MITNALVTTLRKKSPRTHARPGEGEPEDAKTCPILLDRVRDWRDHPAWAEFYEHYNPLLKRWCRRFSLDDEASDELCQRIWVELTARMPTFRYNPGQGFRRWLWRLFRSRAIDMLRRRARQAIAYGEVPPDILPGVPDRDPSDDRDSDEGRVSPMLVEIAEEAQAAVRARVDAETWRAFWIVAIEDRTIREAAEALGKSYTAIYTGCKRVDGMLRAEGEKRLAAMSGRPAGPAGG